MPPFPVTFIVGYASLQLAVALSNDVNPLDTSICHNLLEAAKRDLRNGERAVSNYRVMYARGRLLSTKEA